MKTVKYIVWWLGLFATFAFIGVDAQTLPLAKPAAVQMSADKLAQIDGLIAEALAANKMPGAVVLVGRRGKIVFRKAYGRRAVMPTEEAMPVEPLFDLASLTKPLATATSIMILVEQGKLRLSDQVGRYIPEIEDENAKKITIKQLLTHTSGYRPDFDLREKWSGQDGMLSALKKEKLINPPGSKFVYSDIGFIVLGEIIQRVGKYDLPYSFKENISKPLTIKHSGFFVKVNLTDRNVGWLFSGTNDDLSDEKISPEIVTDLIAPTEKISGQQNYLGSAFAGVESEGEQILRGQVHDPTAYRMNGIAGHAGLFSTADDLARFCQMLLNGGTLNGQRILSANTVALMTKPFVISETGETRGLGWDIDTSFSSNRGELFPLGSFGHTGFTGTGIWIDPLSETYVIFLSNRVHPDGKGDITDVRAKISTVVASAILDITPAQIRDFEAKYYAQIAEFRSQIPNSKSEIILNGIDVLEKENFKLLNGQKIGLVTNQTGKNLQGRSTIDVLKEAENVELVALFSPEHGIRGELDQERINDSVDQKAGLPIFSLYGESRRPTPAQMAQIDAFVFDIQDIGTRFYTYISTLRYILEEAAKARKKVYVLDRPNPINGVDVAGAIADEDKLSFIAPHTLPIRHGMTIGEIALMLNIERNINAELKIVKLQNWRRSMWFDETNQVWTNPSPNMRSLNAATFYPGIGLLETTNLSVGRGTDTPFEIIGAPWINNREFADSLNQKELAGIRFVPVEFTPSASVYKGEKCFGVNLIITDRRKFNPVKTGLVIALALRQMYPQKWQSEKYLRLLVNQKTFEQVSKNEKIEAIEAVWQTSLQEFMKRRAKFLIY